LKFDIVQSVHISAKYAIVDSFGLMFTDENDRRTSPPTFSSLPKPP
jgi:hypothetical protein